MTISREGFGSSFKRERLALSLQGLPAMSFPEIDPVSNSKTFKQLGADLRSLGKAKLPVLSEFTRRRRGEFPAQLL